MNLQSRVLRSPSMAKHEHRAFAALWDWLVKREGKAERKARREVVGDAHGRVLEIGLGVGTNWEYLAEDVEYSGIEPDPHMLKRARAYAKEQGRTLDLQLAAAESLPFEDDTFDVVFETLTFCSVGDVPAGLAEIQRVLKPGGEFRFMDHVKPRGWFGALAADMFTPAWKRIGGGCHLNRRTAVAIKVSGFEFVSLKRYRAGFPMIRGVATLPE